MALNSTRKRRRKLIKFIFNSFCCCCLLIYYYPLTQLADVTTMFLSTMAPPQSRAFFDSKITIATHENSPKPVPRGARPRG
jgi:hypothetical protein